ncbi:MAG TPA: hypothetical protein VKA06_07435 [Spirochaetia bacterium]|nr:hypothetical protein [Spirochaetia bacterium]
MKRCIGSLVVGLLFVSTGAFTQATEALVVKNIGLIVDTPFLHQAELPYESEFLGTYGDELITYEYNGEGMPTFIRYTDLETGTLFLDVDVAYRPDGQIASLAYTSYDETDGSVLYIDSFEFSRYASPGPALATMVTDDGITAQMRLTYDETGRLVEIQEDDAFGEGLFRQERYAWTGEGEASLPFAIEVRFPLDGEVERYRYLYDAAGRLQGLDGVNVLESDPDDRAPVSEWYFYRSRTLDEIFGRIEPTSTETQSTALR